MDAVELLRELTRDDGLRGAELIFDVLDWLDSDNADGPRRWDDKPVDGRMKREVATASEVRMPGPRPLGICQTEPVRPRVADQE